MAKKNKKNVQPSEEQIADTVFDRFYDYTDKLLDELKLEYDDDIGYCFYLTMALAVQNLKDCGMCEHKVQELFENILEKTYEDDVLEGCDESVAH